MDEKVIQDAVKKVEEIFQKGVSDVPVPPPKPTKLPKVESIGTRSNDFHSALQGIHLRRHDNSATTDNMLDKIFTGTLALLTNNVIDSSHAIQKQSIRHESIATDREWNVDEVALFIAELLKSEFFRDSVKTIALDVISSELTNLKEQLIAFFKELLGK